MLTQSSLSYDSIALSCSRFTTIWPHMVAAGDANGSGKNFSWKSCLKKESASDFEVIQIAAGSY